MREIMNRSSWLLIIAFLAGSLVPRLQAQSVLRGVVLGAAGAPQPGALVMLHADRRIATTNMAGKFQFRDVRKGRAILIVQSIGYHTQSDTVNIDRDGVTEHQVVLKELLYTLNSFAVEAGRDRSALSDEVAVRQIDPADISAKAGAVEDVMRGLQSMPGVVAPSDFSSQIVVRGSGPDQTQIVLDGVEVFNPFRLYGGVSMFNPALVREARLYAGGFPAQYGDRLAAVLDVSSRDGDRTRPLSSTVNISAVHANLIAEGPVVLRSEGMTDSTDEYGEDATLPWNGSWIATVRRTYYDLVAGPIVRSTGFTKGEVVLPNFTDFQFRLSLQIDYRNSLALLGITNRDQADFLTNRDVSVLGHLDVKDITFNDVAAATWTHVFHDQMVSKTTLSWYQLGGSNSFSGVMAPRQTLGLNLSTEEYEKLKDSLRREGLNAEDLMSALGDYRFLFRKTALKHSLLLSSLKQHRLEFGVSLDYLDSEMRIGVKLDPRIVQVRQSNPKLSALPETFDSRARYARIGLYVQDVAAFGDCLWIKPGMRVDYYGLMHSAAFSPRLALTWSPHPLLALSSSWGLFHQSPGYEKQFMPGYEVYLTRTVFDLSNEKARNLSTEKSRHLVVGVNWHWSDGWTLMGEAYDKMLYDLIIPNLVTGSRYRVDPVPGGDIRKESGWSAPYAVAADSLTTIPINAGTGTAQGVEVSLRKDFLSPEDPIAATLSYAWAKAERSQHGYTYPFDYDRRHTMTLALQWRFSLDWEMALTFTWGTGFPNNVPATVQPRVYLRKDSITGISRPVLDVDYRGVVFEYDRGGLANLNSSQLPDYLRLDLRLTTHPRWFGWKWDVYLDVINATNRKNIMLYEYYVDRDSLAVKSSELSMLPILPSFGVHIQF